MNKYPAPDAVTEKYLSERVMPENMDCGGIPEHFATVGHGHIKPDAAAKVTGTARYTADLKLPRMLYGKMLRSPHPHAEILSIDTSAAEAMMGVAAVITGKDFSKTYGIIPWTRDERPLCRTRVRFIGDEVAAVAAVSERAAQLALDLIRVEYKLLAPVFEPGLGDKAIHEKRPDNISKKVDFEFGDVDQAMQQAEVIIADDFYYEASTHAPIENHAVLASYEADGRLTVWSATQTPHYLHADLCRLLDLPATRIRVIKPHLGGGFGGKSEPLPLEFCAALLSMRCGRPVRIQHTREETFLAHRGRHAMAMKLKLGYHPGQGLSIDYEAELDGGAYSSYGMVTTYYSGALNAGIYRVGNYRWKSRRHFTNKPPAGPKRGHGTVQPRFALECLLDRLAEQLAEDPIDMRKRLFAGENTETVNGLKIGSSGFIECLDRCAERANWQAKFGKLPRGRGIGVAGSMYISGTNYPILGDNLPQSGILVQANRSGLITIFSGVADVGQGSDGILVQVVAEELGISPDRCRILSGDSDLCPVDLGSYSSRATLMAGNAAISAARALKHQIFKGVARSWSLKPELLACGQDLVFPAAEPERAIPFQKAIELAETVLGTLSATGSYTTPNRGGSYRGALVGPSPAYSFTVHIAEVEVDEETGMLCVTRVVAAHDCGKALNPVHVTGQIEGSVYMGTGEATMEAYVCKDGALITPSLLEYKLPTILDTPDIEAIIVEAPDPEGPYGAKEAGEGPLHPAIPAVANAIYDAVGVRLTCTPFTAHSILQKLLEKSRMETVA